MIVTELALTVILLAGAGLMIRSFVNLSASDIGFSTDHLMVMRMQLPSRSTLRQRPAAHSSIGSSLASSPYPASSRLR